MLTKTPKKKGLRFVAGMVGVLLAVNALAAGIGSTFADQTSSKNANGDVVVTITQNPDNSWMENINVGQTYNDNTVAGAFKASSSDPAIGTVRMASGVVQVTGVSAGVLAVAAGSTAGNLLSMNYQIVDPANIGGYTLKNGGYLYFSGPSSAPKNANAVVTNLVSTNPSAAFAKITWTSLNTDVATIASDGTITPVANGACIVTGQFIDQWGVHTDLHILVAVGVAVQPAGTDNLADLMRLLDTAKALNDISPSPFTDGSLAALKDAITQGEAVVDGYPATAAQIDDPAIKDLNDAIAGLTAIGGGGLIKGPDGKWYKPLGQPPRVYEVVNQDGTPADQPPKYVYDKSPNNDLSDLVPAKPGSDSNAAGSSCPSYWVEDPAGSNIWKQVDMNGNLTQDPAIWGGPDGTFGGGDDQVAKKMADGSYWIDKGQNVWQKVTGPTTLGPLTGGGTDGDPSTAPVTPIFDNTDVSKGGDGYYYVGPLDDGNGGQIYYGDDHTGPGNGKVDSSATQLADQSPYNDVAYYLIDGKMVRATSGIKIDPVSHLFPSAAPGYTMQNPLTATVTNTGNKATGILNVALSGPDASSFTLYNSALVSIPAGGTGKITVVPNLGLAIGTYKATVTVSGANGLSATLDLTFTVTPAPVYGIALDRSGTYDFQSAKQGYAPIAPLSVKVTNTGNMDTGALTVALSGPNASSFTLSTTSIPSLDPNGTASANFTVAPATGLSVGTYTATVTVSGANGITATLNVKFTVVSNLPPCAFTLNQSGMYNFGDVDRTEKTGTLNVTINNTGSDATGPLTITVTGDNGRCFSVSPTSLASIPVGGSASFKVNANYYAPDGTYTATVTVTSPSGSVSQSFQVTIRIH